MRSLVWGLSLCLPLVAEPQDRPVKAVEMHTPQRLELAREIACCRDAGYPQAGVARVVAIADALVISPRQLYLTMQSGGDNKCYAMGENERVFAIYDLVISPDLSQLKEKLSEILPGEDIRVTATRRSPCLAGFPVPPGSHSPGSGKRLCPQQGGESPAGRRGASGAARSARGGNVAFGHQAVGLQFCGTDRGAAFGVSQINRLTTFEILRPSARRLTPCFACRRGCHLNQLYRRPQRGRPGEDPGEADAGHLKRAGGQLSGWR